MATVLLASLDASLSSAVSSALSEQGHTAAVITDGRECPPMDSLDAAVVDLELPPRNPHLLLDALLSGAGAYVPVVLIGALLQKQPTTISLWRARTFMEKPLDARKLLTELDSALPEAEGEGARFIGELLAEFFEAKKTGVLVFRFGAVEKRMFLEEGYPRFSASNQKEDRFGDMLVRKGIISPEQYDEAVGEMKAGGKRMGEILLAKGFLKREDLIPLLVQQQEDIILNMFHWKKKPGAEFREGEVAGEGAVAIKSHPFRLVLEGVRRSLSLKTLTRWVGSPEVVPVLSRDFEDRLKGTGVNKGVTCLALMDGTRSLRDVMKLSGMGAFDVLSFVTFLVMAGVCDLKPPTP